MFSVILAIEEKVSGKYFSKIILIVIEAIAINRPANAEASISL